MTETAPIARPSRCTPLRAYAGEIHAAPSLVFAALERRIRTHSGDAGIAVNSPAHFLVVQGGWWYRAEYRVLESDAGARIEHEILNVAATVHWAAPLVGRRALSASAAEFGSLLTELAAELES